MRSYTAAFVMALALAALLTPVVLKLALRFGAVATPGGRHLHQKQIPRLGGVAIAVSTLVPLVVLALLNTTMADFAGQNKLKALGLLLGSLLLCAVGALDDIRTVSARNKLLVQLAAAGIACAFGFRIQTVYLPYLGIVEMGVFAVPVTMVWIIGITNAVNLIDGLDGLAAGVVFFAAATNFVVAMVGLDTPNQALTALLMAALMGALIGFLFYNFNPARIFMGDSGSYFLGFVLATSSLLAPMQKTSTTVALLVPMVALGVPIFDTLFSIVRRYFERRPVFSPDRGHIHHRLLEMGVTHRRAVLTLYGVSVALAVAAVAIALGRDWEVGFAILGASTVLIGLVRFVGYFQYTHARLRRRERFYDTQVQLLRRLIPDLYRHLHSARDEAHITRVLGWLGERLESSSVQLEDAAGTAQLSWNDSSISEPSRRGSLRASFDSGPRGLRLVVSYRSDVALSSQAEVLLQLIADQVHRSLLAVGSALVAIEAAEAEAAAASEAPLPSTANNPSFTTS